ncbi:MAG: hypothetical protein JXR03_08680 [Cyclobacteriaceae bacterium]
MKNLRLLLFPILILSSSATIYSQKIEAYQILSEGNYKDLKKGNFDYDSISKNYGNTERGDLLPSTLTDLRKNFLIPETANERACIILFFKNENDKIISAENAGFQSITFNSPEILKDLCIDALHKSEKENYATIIPISKIGKRIRDVEEVEMLIHFNDNSFKSVWFEYASFPYADEIENWKARYESNKANSRDAWTHRLVKNTWTPMHVGIFPAYHKTQSDTLKNSLRPEEGKNGFLIGGNFSMPFTVLKGRDDQSRLFRTFALYINPEFSWRVTKDASSSPVLPLNTKAGLGVYKSFILSKDHKYKKSDSSEELAFSTGDFKTLVFDAQFMHYSNGQDSGAHYYPVDTLPDYRTDYKSGNFSTNYLKVGIMYNSLSSEMRHFSSGLYGRFDFALPGFAEFEDDQKNSYGKQRIEGFIFYKTKIFRTGWPFRFNNHHTKNHGNVPVPGLVQHSLRLDFDLLFGIKDYNINPNKSDRPISMRLRYENHRLTHRSVGYFAQYYLGRDDLNIRYNLWTSYLQLGVTFRFPDETGLKKFQNNKLKDTKEFYEKFPCSRWRLPCLKSSI